MVPLLSDLGYYFDEKGVLRSKKDNSTFQFTTQESYEELGSAISEEIYLLLQEKCGLRRIAVKPPNSELDDQNVGFIFVSPDYETKDTILVLIHGSGVVRAGQWARRLIINEDLSKGTQIPYIERAIEKGWGVVVLNTNHNSISSGKLKFSETSVSHTLNSWKWFIETSKAKQIFVVAHSRGGYDMSHVVQQHGNNERLSVICLTDSPCFQFSEKTNDRDKPLFIINYLACGKYDSPQYRVSEFRKDHVAELYAGTGIHECSSYKSIDSIFYILQSNISEENYVDVLTKAKPMVLEEENETEEEKSSSKKKAKELKKEICS